MSGILQALASYTRQVYGVVLIVTACAALAVVLAFIIVALSALLFVVGVMASPIVPAYMGLDPWESVKRGRARVVSRTARGAKNVVRPRGVPVGED
jgi:hypothetical protein